jgi:hypothetical protein
MMWKKSKDSDSNLMRAIVVKQILKNRGMTYGDLIKLVKKHYPDDPKINEEALMERMHKKLGEEWCERIEVALELPKDTLTNIK